MRESSVGIDKATGFVSYIKTVIKSRCNVGLAKIQYIKILLNHMTQH